MLKEHYHAIVAPHAPGRLPQMLRALHGSTAREWNRQDKCVGRQCWYQYWDVSLWTDGDLISRINYVHNNPVKHGYVERAEDYEWSSYLGYLAAEDRDEIFLRLSRFPSPRQIARDDF